jgi:hypothetical protein
MLPILLGGIAATVAAIPNSGGEVHGVGLNAWQHWFVYVFGCEAKLGAGRLMTAVVTVWFTVAPKVTDKGRAELQRIHMVPGAHGHQVSVRPFMQAHLLQVVRTTRVSSGYYRKLAFLELVREPGGHLLRPARGPLSSRLRDADAAGSYQARRRGRKSRVVGIRGRIGPDASQACSASVWQRRRRSRSAAGPSSRRCPCGR